MWFYFDEHYTHLKSFKLVYSLYFPPLDASHNYFELLEMLGIARSSFFRIDAPTEFDTLYVPDECFFHQPDGFTPEYLNLLAHLPSVPPIERAPKIYLSRTQLHSWKDFNEIDVENIFKNQGFKIIYPEKLSFKDQLAYFQNAEVFAATDGSIAHNLLFCKEQITALILRKCRFFTGYQIIINQLKKANVVYIDASYSPLANRNAHKWAEGIFFLYAHPQLCRYFGLHRKIFPFARFFQAHFTVLRSLSRRDLLHYLDHLFLGFTHPLRAKLKIGTRFKQLKKWLHFSKHSR